MTQMGNQNHYHPQADPPSSPEGRITLQRYHTKPGEQLSNPQQAQLQNTATNLLSNAASKMEKSSSSTRKQKYHSWYLDASPPSSIPFLIRTPGIPEYM